MPVEIKELIIRAVAESANPPGGDNPSGAAEAPRRGRSKGCDEAIIEAAVSEVMRILRASRER